MLHHKREAVLRAIYFLILLFITLLAGCDSPLLSHIKESKLPLSQHEPIVVKKGKWISALALTLDTHWEMGPHGNPALESQLALSFRDSTGELQDLPEDITVIHYAFMPSMGHGSADDGFILRENLGEYLIKEVFFSMSGDWRMTFEFWKSGVKVDQVVLEFLL